MNKHISLLSDSPYPPKKYASLLPLKKNPNKKQNM